MPVQSRLLRHPIAPYTYALSARTHNCSLKSYFRWAILACRQETLKLVSDICSDTLSTQSHPDFSPVGWHLGHIAHIQSVWLLGNSSAASHLFSSTGVPKAARQNLPSLSELLTYLDDIQTEVATALATADVELDPALWQWVVQHEAQHAETIAMVLAMHRLKDRHRYKGSYQFQEKSKEKAVSLPDLLTDMVFVGAGEFTQGSDLLVATDNERPAHTLALGSYWIDRRPVTCGQYQQFLQAEGYQERQWWTAEGWQWKQEHRIEEPLYWHLDDISRNALSDWAQYPVCGVSWYEADAYARFVGKRLPTEAEWAKAASWDVTTGRSRLYPWGDTLTIQCNYGQSICHTTSVNRFADYASPYGCEDMLGNVWEWTDTWFCGYPGFRAFPCADYSQAYFDGAHRVLRGGSWSTPHWVLRNSTRNWYHPHRREMFAGFRCAI